MELALEEATTTSLSLTSFCLTESCSVDWACIKPLKPKKANDANKVFIRKCFTNKRGHYSVVHMSHYPPWIVFWNSLGSITRPGSLGIISALKRAPLVETAQR